MVATFGMLYLFYRVFHPWVSEGISVGFEPGREKRKDMMEDIYDLEDNENDKRCATSDAENHHSQSVHPYGIIVFYYIIR